MARMSGALAGVLLLILVSLPASAQNSPATQVNCDSGQSIQTTVDTAPAGGRIDVSGPLCRSGHDCHRQGQHHRHKAVR